MWMKCEHEIILFPTKKECIQKRMHLKNAYIKNLKNKKKLSLLKILQC